MKRELLREYERLRKSIPKIRDRDKRKLAWKRYNELVKLLGKKG